MAIEHQAPGCVAAGKYARVAACFEPQGALARARVYFRAGGTANWFYVEMGGTPPCLEGILPRPKKGLERIEYYLAATDRSFAESRTPERVFQVTSNGRCPAGPIAPVADSASVVIGSVSGAAPVGFVTGGGLSPLLIAGGVAVVGGGAAAVIVARWRRGPAAHDDLHRRPTTTTTTTTTHDHHHDHHDHHHRPTTTTTTTTHHPRRCRRARPRLPNVNLTAPLFPVL